MTSNIEEKSAKIIALLQEKVRLEPFHRLLFYVVFGILWGSGALWLLSEWFKDPELGSARTLLQIFSMKVHGAAMLLYLAMLGTLITHIRRGTALKTNRFSGFSVLAINAILALTGWMLYYLADDKWREWTSIVHWVIGFSALLIIVGHIVLGRKSASKLVDTKAEAYVRAGNDLSERSIEQKKSSRLCMPSR